MPRTGSKLGVCRLLAAVSCCVAGLAIAQSAPNPGGPAIVRSVQPLHDGGALAVEILTDRPVTPNIQTIDRPARLVIDLPGTTNGLKVKRIAVAEEAIKAIRVDQYLADPPITRVVVDLNLPVSYSWDAAGNRLMIRLKPPESKTTRTPEPAPAPTLSLGTKPAVVPVSPGGGNVILAGGKVSTGSSITAGADTAILHIARGGEVRVCPGSTISVTTSPNGQDLMLGVSTGAFETHYALGASADSILTPDFRVLLPGPGEFDFALSADSHGNTCIRALMGNTASVIVSELMGDRTYQVKPTEAVVFHGGQIEKVGRDVPLECGCPPVRPAVMQAAVTPPVEARLPAHVKLGDQPASSPMPSLPTNGPETAPLPPSKPNDVHIQVEAPFVFRATDMGPSPAPVHAAENISMYPRDLRFATEALPPPAPPPPAPAETAQAQEPVADPHRGFFGHIRGFFTAIFR